LLKGLPKLIQLFPIPGNPLSLDRYAYAYYNPLKYTDYSGNFPWLAAIGLFIILTQIPSDVQQPPKRQGNPDIALIGLSIYGLGIGGSGGYIADVIATSIDCLTNGCEPTTAMMDMAIPGPGINQIDNFAGDIAEVADSIPDNDYIDIGKGFDSFSKYKQEFGSAGTNKGLHHYIEQSQIEKSGFPEKLIHNPDNIVSIDNPLHWKISGYYSSKPQFAGGLRVRDWLAGQSINEQYEFGLDAYERFRSGIID